MIKQLECVSELIGGNTVGTRYPNNKEIMDKINEVVKVINDFEFALETIANRE